MPTPHPHTAPRTTAVELDAALLELDAELEQMLDEGELGRGQAVRIRAIGGYAIMGYGLRPADPATGVDGLTCDIDTLTPAYPAAVRSAISRVGARRGLAPDWLNNDVLGEYGDHSADERERARESAESAAHLSAMVGAQWVAGPMSHRLRHIDLTVADIPTLTRLKLAAVEDLALTGRNQDLPDVLNLLRAEGIDTAAALQAAYGGYLRDLPQAQHMVELALAGQSAQEITAQTREQAWDLDALMDAIAGESIDDWQMCPEDDLY